MDEWTMMADPLGGWRCMPPRHQGAPLGPRYRGAFEQGEPPPPRVRVASIRWNHQGDGACARFRAPRPIFARRRDFGVSVDVDPAVWAPLESARGWHFFVSESGGTATVLGLWSSLPATWLAARSDGTPIPPPWRELWTFGTDHAWACRIIRIPANDTAAKAGFPAACAGLTPPRPRPGAGTIHPVDVFRF